MIMTQEEKDLLLRDLCSRLPYDVKALCENEIVFIKSCIDDNVYVKFNGASIIVDMLIDEVKPYLFPLSSMKWEQKKELIDILEDKSDDEFEYKVVDLYNKNHIDYRGLIPMGLAIDATNLNIY